MKVLEINHIQKSFNNATLHVLKDISLSVDKGEVVSIIGPSGSGKSTLLRCATLLTEMDSGELIYMGEVAAKNGPDGKAVYSGKAELKKIRSIFGLVFQNFNLFPHFSVLKNLVDPQVHVLGRTKQEAEERALALLKKMGLEEKANAYPCELSGGQQQRVLLARAMCATKKLLLLDEPVTGLDPVATNEMYNLIKLINLCDSTSVIMISHDIHEAVRYATHILHLGNRQLFFGTTAQYRESDLARRFVGGGRA